MTHQKRTTRLNVTGKVSIGVSLHSDTLDVLIPIDWLLDNGFIPGEPISVGGALVITRYPDGGNPVTCALPDDDIHQNHRDRPRLSRRAQKVLIQEAKKHLFRRQPRGGYY